jgi:hypothetical protein
VPRTVALGRPERQHAVDVGVALDVDPIGCVGLRSRPTRMSNRSVNISKNPNLKFVLLLSSPSVYSERNSGPIVKWLMQHGLGGFVEKDG